MGVLSLMLLLTSAEPVDDGLAKKMLPIYLKEAEAYSVAVASAPKTALELKKEPVFEWQNLIRDGVQQGAIFLWLRDGRPAAIGCIFSHPFMKGRKINHELHALDPERLLVTRDADNQWKPEVGLARKELADAPAPAATPGARLIQMKKLAAEFSGHSLDKEKERLELRLLPTPLYRYPTAKTGVIDGALFALVSNAGTDPEVLLVEAKETDGKARWEYVCARFSDLELRVQQKDVEVWSSVPSETNTSLHDPQHLYRVYPEKYISPEGKVLGRFRSTPKKPWGELVPIEDR